MKFLFIVRGEGRGHFTQAITLEGMLLRNGYEVVEVLVGKSSSRILSGFFNRSTQTPVKHSTSPNFLSTTENKRANLKKSFVYNLIHIPEYFRSMCYTDQRTKETGAEAVINLYELLTGLTHALFRPSVLYVCAGHQYLFLHKNFEFPRKSMVQLFILRFFTRLTSLRANGRLALSFHKVNPDRAEGITVVPPLLRREMTVIQPEQGDYIYGCAVNSGLADSVGIFHVSYPEVPMHPFWDKQDVDEVVKVDATLSSHQIDDVKFPNRMASCRVYASMAGFESICGAIYLGKPVLMVPAHIKQDCSVYDAYRSDVEIIGESFDLESLLCPTGACVPSKEFIRWVRSSERQIIGELERLIDQQSATTVPTLTNYFPI